jgi:hypothetical protein
MALEINAMSFERPRPIDHVGQNGDASRADGLIEEPIATVLVACRCAWVGSCPIFEQL